MKKKILLALLAMSMMFTIGFALTGCGGNVDLSREAVDQIQIAMTRDQVQNIVGRATDTSAFTNVMGIGSGQLVWTHEGATLRLEFFASGVIGGTFTYSGGTRTLSVLGWA